MHNTVRQEWRAFVARQCVLWRAKKQNHASTILQAIGMIVNNGAFLGVWLLFFQATGSVNGWGQIQTLGLLGYAFLVFGLAVVCSSGAGSLPRFIASGRLDVYLLQPRWLWLSIATSVISESALGDVVLGVALLVIFIVNTPEPLWSLFGILMSIPAGASIITSYFMTSGLIGFYVRDSEANILVRNLRRVMLTPSLYPSTLFPPLMKSFFIFVIPALCVGGLPIEMVQNHTWWWLAVMYGLAVLWISISVFGLKYAVRRYESGNAMGTLD